MSEQSGSIPIKKPDGSIVACYVPFERRCLKYKLTTPFGHKLGSCWSNVAGCVPPTETDPKVYVAVANRRMDLPAGYAWNGANWFPEPTWIRYPSLVHDAQCQLLNDGHVYCSGQPITSKDHRRLRKCADQEFRDILRASGHPGWANTIYRAMRIYAFFWGR